MTDGRPIREDASRLASLPVTEGSAVVPFGLETALGLEPVRSLADLAPTLERVADAASAACEILESAETPADRTFAVGVLLSAVNVTRHAAGALERREWPTFRAVDPDGENAAHAARILGRLTETPASVSDHAGAVVLLSRVLAGTSFGAGGAR